EDVYEAICAPLVADTLRGFAGAIFAYGATGAGKTHTMTGLMSRALNNLFSSIAESDHPNEYEVSSCSIYIIGRCIRSYMCATSRRHVAGLRRSHIRVRSHRGRQDPHHDRAYVARTWRGPSARDCAPGGSRELISTALSSRSGTASWRYQGALVSHQVEGGTQRGRLFLIDLAGSERAGLRARRLEGAHINRSLLALGNCIMALSGGASRQAEGGTQRGRLCLIGLAGSERAGLRARRLEGADINRSLLALWNCIMALSGGAREDIHQLEDEKSKEEKAESEAHLKSLREAIVSTFKQQMRLRRRLMELDSHLLGLALDAERQHATISHWEARFNRLYKPINMAGGRLSTQQSYSKTREQPAEMQEAWFISHWEARFNRLYKPINMAGGRLSTQQSYR
ncbi:Uncharacterized protein OBRU01_03897, partial [Operophtera brumata]